MKELRKALIYLGFFALIGFALYFTGNPKVLIFLLLVIFLD